MKHRNQSGDRQEPAPVRGQKVAKKRRHRWAMRDPKAARGKRTRSPARAAPSVGQQTQQRPVPGQKEIPAGAHCDPTLDTADAAPHRFPRNREPPPVPGNGVPRRDRIRFVAKVGEFRIVEPTSVPTRDRLISRSLHVLTAAATGESRRRSQARESLDPK
jgi:hypothetical protein